MAKFTFLEIHLDDSEFNPPATAPFGPGEKDVEAADGAPPVPEADTRPRAALAAVVGLLFLAVVAYVAKRRFLGDGSPDVEDPEFEP